MYWQKRINSPNKDMEIENKILKIRKENPNYGYRRITAMLKRLGLKINKKKVQRLVQNLKLQVKSFSRKSRKYSSYKGQVWKIADNKIKRNFKVEKPYTQITTDTTEFKYFEKDKSGTYQIDQYTSKLESNGITQSMSRKGNCLDNSPMENFFGILKQEVYYGNKFYSYEHLKQTIEDFIKYYNEERIKEKLGYLSPVEYRKLNAA